MSVSSDSATPNTPDGSATFTLRFDADTELTGYMKLRLWISSDASDDLDLFVGIRKFDRRGKELHFPDFNHIEHGLVARGWQWASHRELDEKRSTPSSRGSSISAPSSSSRANRAGRNRDLAVEHAVPQGRGPAVDRARRGFQSTPNQTRYRSSTDASR